MPESNPETYRRFSSLNYDDFRRMAVDPSLSCYEKIGFPDSYRKGKEQAIFRDMVRKLDGLSQQGKTVLDIGPGCSEIPHLLSNLCQKNSNSLLFVDSPEMLSHLPDEKFILKYPAYFPDCPALFREYQGKVDVIIIYSVFHYIFTESNIWQFLDSSLSLLAEGGQMLIGDIPNISKRKRFFSSPNGVRYHQAFTGSDAVPEVLYHQIEKDQIDDAVIFGLLQRARLQGFDSFVLPQHPELPMTNRREDILICRP